MIDLVNHAVKQIQAAMNIADHVYTFPLNLSWSCLCVAQHRPASLSIRKIPFLNYRNYLLLRITRLVILFLRVSTGVQCWPRLVLARTHGRLRPFSSRGSAGTQCIPCHSLKSALKDNCRTRAFLRSCRNGTRQCGTREPGARSRHLSSLGTSSWSSIYTKKHGAASTVRSASQES